MSNLKLCRQYFPIWKQLKEKEDHICQLEVSRKFVSRIVKAVIKEKNNDIHFKLQLRAEFRKAKLFHYVHNYKHLSLIYFRLEFSPSGVIINERI